MVTAIAAVSVVLQVIAAAVALQLIRVTGGLKAWVFIATALVLMAVRRAIPLLDALGGKTFAFGPVPFELVGAAISALMVAGVACITPLFQSIQRSRDALRDSEERYHRLFDSGNDAVFVYPIDAGGRGRSFAEVNDVACRRFGYEREELLRLAPAELEADRADKAAGEVRVSPFKGKQGLFETSYRTKTGEAVPVEVSSCLFELKGQPTVLSVVRDVTERKRAQSEREGLICELQEALAKVKTLTGFLPICASCKKIRDDNGSWTVLERYIHEHSNAEFSHGLCPECARILYPDHYR